MFDEHGNEEITRKKASIEVSSQQKIRKHQQRRDIGMDKDVKNIVLVIQNLAIANEVTWRLAKELTERMLEEAEK